MKYCGKVTARVGSFEKRNDRYHFEKLSRKKYPHYRLLANLSREPDSWIGDVVLDEERFTSWRKTVSSLDYVFREDVKKLDLDDFDSNFRVKDGEHPPLLKQVLRGEVTWESFVIMNDLLKFTPHWNRSIEDQVVWPAFFFRMKKYSVFVPGDRYKYKTVLKSAVEDHT